MAINGYSRDEFGTKLNTLVFPSHPIDSIQHLLGRTVELDTIGKALYATGRHIFIYGDRGVGKSSLAATAANQYQSADSKYIDISCSPESTLTNVVANIAYQATNTSRLKSTTKNKTQSLNLKYFSLISNESSSIKNFHDEIHTISDAVELLKEVSKFHSDKPIIVVDEFDRIESEKERNLFADLLKQLGDKKVGIKFIFTGVAKSLRELLGAHQSASRQLESIELPKLNWNARWDIALSAAREFDISIPKDIYIRIAALSDGYPYYVHLITEKLLWQAFDDNDVVVQIKKEHFHSALTDVIQSIAAELRQPYEAAINQRSEHYEEVLWATADSEYLQRSLKDMYSSYQFIMRQIDYKSPLDNQKFAQHIRNLKKPLNGEILVSEARQGMYSYREKMLRGYVRIQAEAHGIELLGEEDRTVVKQIMHTPRASTGYYQSSPPKNVNFKRSR